jgi:AAA+ ATPase superfamily predicted ATPase
MAENPYFHRTPIRDSRFFIGRTVETDEVLNHVSRKQPVSIVGPRRIGKTSLLLHLRDPQVKAKHGLGDDYVFVYVTCEILSGAQNKYDVYRVLLRRTTEVLPGDHIAEHSFREPMTYLDFENCLDEITASSMKVVILLDEFEAIADNRQLGKDFFDELRALGQTGKVVYVTASGETLYNLSFHDKNILSSPFFNMFSTVWLGFMNPQEARNLVDGLAAMADFEGFDENDYDFLQEKAGFHPFYRQVACYHLFEEKIKAANSTALDYDLVKRQFAREMQDHFQYAWKRLSNDEQKALKLISRGRLDEVAAEEIERLEQKCLVYQGKIFSSVFAGLVIHETERVPRLSSEDYLRAADRLEEDIERLGRKEARLDFSASNRRLREAIRSEEEAIIQLDRLARRHLGRDLREYVLEPDK